MTKQRMNRKQLGALGESAAVQYLAGQGMQVITRNWRCRSGEIDIVVLDGEILVFVEVRTRTGTGLYGTPQESVDTRKQYQVLETAQVYVHMKKQHHRQLRFDVVSVLAQTDGEVIGVELIRNAF